MLPLIWENIFFVLFCFKKQLEDEEGDGGERASGGGTGSVEDGGSEHNKASGERGAYRGRRGRLLGGGLCPRFLTKACSSVAPLRLEWEDPWVAGLDRG